MPEATNQRVYGPQYKLIGKNYATPDLLAKVTGKSKYAEDFRAEGMLFCKLSLSPFPHARVRQIDAREALAMPGVRAILTADDLPAPADTLTDNGAVIKASKWGERGLTMEPVYQGEPILAVAAVDELTAAEAIERIRIDFEPLPFAVDPLDTLRPGGPNPRTDGNIWTTPAGATSPAVKELKWTEADFAESNYGRLPMGKAPDEWSYGDLDAGFRNAALVLDETFVTPDTSHQTLETRSAMAYWQNGKVYIHTGTQSTAQTRPAIARWLNIDAEKIVFISEYTGGGFGSKITGGVTMIIPALLAKKANAPVMMRISREEETFIGRARPGFQGRMKVGFSQEGRILAVDMFVISDNGPYDAQGDSPTSGRMVSLLYQPQAMRWRGVTVASFWLDFWAIWPDRDDLVDTWGRVRRFMGRPAPPPRRFAKYPLENKLYHGAIIATGLSAIGTGVFMMSRVHTIFFSRNPYLFSDMTWGLMYVFHGLAGIGLIALVTVHVYFAVRPEKLDITRSMIFGTMRREFYLKHYDPRRWVADSRTDKEV